MTRSVTTWARIEPQSSDLEPGPDRALQARVHDPAWLLGRQWQLGELTGEDAGSPAWVRVRATRTAISRLRPAGATSGRALGADEVLEAAIEAEPEPVDWTRAAQAGAHFLAALRLAGLEQHLAAFREAFPLPDPATSGLDAAGRRRLRLLRRGGCDGTGLRTAARGPDGQPVLPPRPSLPAADRDRVLAVLRRWIAGYPDLPAGSGTAWVPERLEYRATIAAADPAGPGTVLLAAPAYPGGELDWTDLRAAPPDTDPGAATAVDPTRTELVHRGLAARVGYPGMPANRWWEFEDGAVSYGDVEAEGGDVARLLLVEFATVYGNDWFLAPLDVELGSLLAVRALVVTDTFGQATLVGPATAPGWAMFAVSGAPAGVLVLPAVTGACLEGPPVEELVLSRDEAANLAWGIERTVTGPAGDVVDRHQRWRDRIAALPAAAAASDLPSYRLATDPPDHWIPLVPRSDGHRSIRLHRGIVARGDGLDVPPLGRLLEPDRPLALFEEELPRGGLLITRSWQLARTAGGETVSWLARRVRVGRGEARGGLSFDKLE